MSLLSVSEPIFDIAQLAHVELLTPDFDGALRFFFKDLLGMQETQRRGGSAYLHGYEEQYHLLNIRALRIDPNPREQWVYLSVEKEVLNKRVRAGGCRQVTSINRLESNSL